MKNDVIAVIGTGAGGLPAATALVENGHKVVLIERGNYLQSSQIKTDSYQYEIGNTPWKYHSAEWKGNIELQRGIGVGGSTLYYQAVVSKFERKKLKGWGISVENYQKYEDLVVKRMNIAGIDQPHHNLNPIGKHLMKSLKQLNWNSKQTSVAILSKSVGERPSCVKCGLCIYGCLPGDKTGTHNGWMPSFNEASGGKVMTKTQAVSIELSNKKKARAVNLVSQGKEISLPVKAIVIAAGTLETPHLLLQSRQQHAPYGIGNRQVGRNLQVSLMYSQLVALEQVKGSSAYGIPVDIVVKEFEGQGIRLYQGRNLAGITGPVSAAKFYANKYGIVGQRQWMRDKFHKLAGLAATVESSIFYEDGLTSEKAFYKTFANSDLQQMEKAAGLIEQWRKSSNAELLYASPISEKSMQGSMFRGTCRMGNDVKKSAVSAETGKLHGYDNIYITDASILNKGMISDPSLTLQSLGYYYGSKMAQALSV